MQVKPAGILEDTRGASKPVTGGIIASLPGTAGQTRGVKPGAAGQNCSLLWSPKSKHLERVHSKRFPVFRVRYAQHTHLSITILKKIEI
ncbi:hypothetical protein OIU77_008832 [Salix suchowensis]|uniref:Uncharacterized protein n=1 Tax=Salix suchowensis TaxID=1278906 RepID=A0ABQ9AC98_9ROSI|nr:hypothetical protein OIU77_008832 [Salix suchowensis]